MNKAIGSLTVESDPSALPSGTFTRRALIRAGVTTLAIAALSPRSLLAAPSRLLVNDVTQLNPVRVKRLVAPRATTEISQAIVSESGPVSIGGGRYSMGGQIAAEQSLHLDMRQFNQVVGFSPTDNVIRVQAGMRWRDLQSVIDPHDLSVKIMQSFANFTVGGALSVNAHGRYVGAGPVINSVRALQLVLADGSVAEASRTAHSELFHAVIGGYGAFGVITEVELDLAPNAVMERQIHRMALVDYLAFFEAHVRGNQQAIMHNADLVPPRFDQATAVTWQATNKPLTVEDRLVPQGQSYAFNEVAMWSMARLPGGPVIRKEVVDPLRYSSHPVVRRNYEASTDVASLGPIATSTGTYALQEYFVPVAMLDWVVPRMAAILQAHRVSAVNISIRHSPAAPEPFLSWAREEVFSLVLYYWQPVGAADCEYVGTWTRALIEAVLAVGGTYYLPYQLHATTEQFSRAYPNAARFIALKAQWDPEHRFQNKLLNKYCSV